MKTSLLLLLALAIAVLAYDPTYTGSQWQSKSASEKFTELSTQITKNKKPYGWYSAIHTAELFIENLDRSFDYAGDDMPDQGLFNAEQRPKLIHSVGAVANVKFVSNGRQNYTGIFKGADQCFLRFSLAAKPETSPPLSIPGISLKCMRDGVPSANLFAMYSLRGQPSLNFFAHDFTNHAPEMDVDAVDFATRQLYNSFAKVSQWPTMLGLSGMAAFDQQGVAPAQPVFPFRLVFHPTAELHSKFPDQPTFADDDNDEYFIPQLESLAPGPVYSVFAQRDPYNTALEELGVLVMNDSPTGSRFGDKDLFFQHTRMEDDIAQHPEWLSGLQSIVAEQKQTTTYTYPDLPW